MVRTCCVRKLFWMSKQKTICVHNMFSTCSELASFVYWTCNSILLDTFCNISILNILKIFTVSFEIVIERTFDYNLLKDLNLLCTLGRLRCALLYYQLFPRVWQKKTCCAHIVVYNKNTWIYPLFFSGYLDAWLHSFLFMIDVYIYVIAFSEIYV